MSDPQRTIDFLDDLLGHDQTRYAALQYDGAQQSCEASTCCVHDYAKLTLRHRKGADPAEWPADLRVRDWPTLVVR